MENLTFTPLNQSTWPQFEELFGPRGACDNCWCMYPRLIRAEFNAGKKHEGNKKAMRDLVKKEETLGLLAFHNDKAIAWCALAPRSKYLRIENSRNLKRLDNLDVWSLPCFFVKKEFRHLGLSKAILTAVINYARREGIQILEAYPLPDNKPRRDAEYWWGKLSTFLECGFEIAGYPSTARPVVRYFVETQPKPFDQHQ